MDLLTKIKEVYSFWKSFIKSDDKEEFVQKNKSTIKTHTIVFLATSLACVIAYTSMKPAVKGACRIILRADEKGLDFGFDRITGVEAKKVTTGTTLREVKSIGTLKANAEVVIKAEISGKISEISFIEGAEVKEGDTLITFEDDLYKAEKAKYEAEYLMRKSEYERVDNLYKQKVGAKKTYDEAFAQMMAAKAQLESATAQLKRTVIKAPFDGVIGILKGSATPGNMVQQQTELVCLVDNSQMKVEFSIPAKYIKDIAPGQNVDITVDTYPDKTFSGSVVSIDSEIDKKNNSVLVKATIPNKRGELRHGMFANVRLVTGEKDGVILIDDESLMREGSIEYVWIIDPKGRAYRKRVLSGSKDINGVEIVAGLEAGETVVTTGQLKLSEGAKTKILNTEEYEASKQKAGVEQQEELEPTSEQEQAQEERKETEGIMSKIVTKFKSIFSTKSKLSTTGEDEQKGPIPDKSGEQK